MRERRSPAIRPTLVMAALGTAFGLVAAWLTCLTNSSIPGIPSLPAIIVSWKMAEYGVGRSGVLVIFFASNAAFYGLSFGLVTFLIARWR